MCVITIDIDRRVIEYTAAADTTKRFFMTSLDNVILGTNTTNSSSMFDIKFKGLIDLNPHRIIEVQHMLLCNGGIKGNERNILVLLISSIKQQFESYLLWFYYHYPSTYTILGIGAKKKTGVFSTQDVVLILTPYSIMIKNNASMRIPNSVIPLLGCKVEALPKNILKITTPQSIREKDLYKKHALDINEESTTYIFNDEDTRNRWIAHIDSISNALRERLSVDITRINPQTLPQLFQEIGNIAIHLPEFRASQAAHAHLAPQSSLPDPSQPQSHNHSKSPQTQNQPSSTSSTTSASSVNSSSSRQHLSTNSTSSSIPHPPTTPKSYPQPPPEEEEYDDENDDFEVPPPPPEPIAVPPGVMIPPRCILLEDMFVYAEDGTVVGELDIHNPLPFKDPLGHALHEIFTEPSANLPKGLMLASNGVIYNLKTQEVFASLSVSEEHLRLYKDPEYLRQQKAELAKQRALEKVEKLKKERGSKRKINQRMSVSASMEAQRAQEAFIKHSKNSVSQPTQALPTSPVDQQHDDEYPPGPPGPPGPPAPESESHEPPGPPGPPTDPDDEYHSVPGQDLHLPPPPPPEFEDEPHDNIPPPPPPSMPEDDFFPSPPPPPEDDYYHDTHHDTHHDTPSLPLPTTPLPEEISPVGPIEPNMPTILPSPSSALHINVDQDEDQDQYQDVPPTRTNHSQSVSTTSNYSEIPSSPTSLDSRLSPTSSHGLFAPVSNSQTGYATDQSHLDLETTIQIRLEKSATQGKVNNSNDDDDDDDDNYNNILGGITVANLHLTLKQVRQMILSEIDSLPDYFVFPNPTVSNVPVNINQEDKTALHRVLSRFDSDNLFTLTIRASKPPAQPLSFTSLTVYIEGSDVPIGLIEVNPRRGAATSLLKLRDMICDEIDDLPEEYFFLWDGIRLSKKQEERKYLIHLKSPQITLRPVEVKKTPEQMAAASRAEAETNNAFVSRPITKPAQPGRMALGSNLSLLSALRGSDARNVLKKVEDKPKKADAPPPTAIGLPAGLAERLLLRRQLIEDNDDFE